MQLAISSKNQRYFWGNKKNNKVTIGKNIKNLTELNDMF